MLNTINNIINKSEDTQTYIKSAQTLGRLPNKTEIGSQLTTWVKNTKGDLVVETSNIISNDVVIARNPKAIGNQLVGTQITEHKEDIYNEWLVPKDTWVNNYGQLPVTKISADDVANGYSPPSSSFQSMAKIASIKALEVTPAVFNELSKVLISDGDQLILPVEWSNDGMKFGLGDFITDQGYTINKNEMEKTYSYSKKIKP